MRRQVCHKKPYHKKNPIKRVFCATYCLGGCLRGVLGLSWGYLGVSVISSVTEPVSEKFGTGKLSRNLHQYLTGRGEEGSTVLVSLTAFPSFFELFPKFCEFIVLNAF